MFGTFCKVFCNKIGICFCTQIIHIYLLCTAIRKSLLYPDLTLFYSILFYVLYLMRICKLWIVSFLGNRRRKKVFKKRFQPGNFEKFTVGEKKHPLEWCCLKCSFFMTKKKLIQLAANKKCEWKTRESKSDVTIWPPKRDRRLSIVSTAFRYCLRF